jgi:DNA-binding MarR family transcriptional regulator
MKQKNMIFHETASTMSVRSAGFVEDYLLYLLARASAQASAQFHEVVRGSGLSVPQWRVLGALWSGPHTVGALAAMTLIKQPTLTKLLDRMEAARLVARSADRGDRRRVSVAITVKGRALAERLIARAHRHEAQVLAGYSTAEAAALKRVLKTLIARTAPVP